MKTWQTDLDRTVLSKGAPYRARVMGTQRAENLWEGHLEFLPASGRGSVLVTGTETTQPNLTDLEYWASGLEPVFLEGALARAREPRKPNK